MTTPHAHGSHATNHPAAPGRVAHDRPPQPDGVEPGFEQLKLHPDLLRGIHDLGFLRPAPIQAQAIPPILEGRDVIGCAQTGTGKTAAFVLPILHRLMQRPTRPNLRALVLAPTRELALQSMDHLKALSRYVSLKGAAIFGGVPMDPQIRALSHGVDIVSATPGRLLDHLYAGRVDFADLEIFVLDEADRMLDMGFLPDIQKIMRLLPSKRQNLLFSATMPEPVIALVRTFLRDPVIVQVGARSSPAVGIRQAVYPVSRHQKTELLLALLRGQQMPSVLVFTRTKHAADRLSQQLARRGVQVSVLHGNRSQSQRLHALEQFRRGRCQVMVATDIAARGIDIEEISHVINFDVPNTPEDYVHRIGRTARAEATGDAFTLADPDEEPVIRDIERALNRALPRITLPNFAYQKGAPDGGHHRRPRQQGPREGHRGGRPGGRSHGR